MRTRGVRFPVFVLLDAAAQESRCVNGLHIQTFIPDPFWNGILPRGTLITFANGDTVTVADDFEVVVELLMSDGADG
jgi:hypothetical protein